MSPEIASSPSVEFQNPPVSEVVFSVQFDREAIDEVGILSEFWPEIKEDYPRHEKHPPLPPAAETFDSSVPQLQLRIQSFGGAIPQRYWFLNELGTHLVQVQPDRVLFNWRKITGAEKYPRYEALLPEFVRLLQTFLACAQVAAAQPAVAWVELQYINPVEVEPHDDAGHGQLANILNVLVKDPPPGVLPPVEDTQLQERFRITWPNGEPRGRLYLTAVPAFGRDSNPVYVLTLLARGRPGYDELIGGVNDFLGLGHDLIVRGFCEVTRDDMHTRWGRL